MNVEQIYRLLKLAGQMDDVQAEVSSAYLEAVFRKDRALQADLEVWIRAYKPEKVLELLDARQG